MEFLEPSMDVPGRERISVTSSHPEAPRPEAAAPTAMTVPQPGLGCCEQLRDMKRLPDRAAPHPGSLTMSVRSEVPGWGEEKGCDGRWDLGVLLPEGQVWT